MDMAGTGPGPADAAALLAGAVPVPAGRLGLFMAGFGPPGAPVLKTKAVVVTGVPDAAGVSDMDVDLVAGPGVSVYRNLRAAPFGLVILLSCRHGTGRALRLAIDWHVHWAPLAFLRNPPEMVVLSGHDGPASDLARMPWLAAPGNVSAFGLTGDGTDLFRQARVLWNLFEMMRARN